MTLVLEPSGEEEKLENLYWYLYIVKYNVCDFYMNESCVFAKNRFQKIDHFLSQGNNMN